MSTDVKQDLREFHSFIGRQLENGGAAMTVEDSVTEFRAYQEELERCREAIRPALESSLRGESTPLDMREIIGEVTAQLQSEGIAD